MADEHDEIVTSPDSDFAFESSLDERVDREEAESLTEKTPTRDEAHEPAPETTAEGAKGKGAEGSVDEWSPLVSEAEKWGLSADEARAYESPAHLQRAMSHMARVATAYRQHQERQGTQQPTQQPEQNPQSRSAPDTATKYEPKLSAELYDPEIVNEFNAMNEFYSSRMAALQSKLDAVAGHYESQRSNEEIEWLDKQFEAFEPELQEIVGKGRTNDLPQGSKELAERKKLYDTAVALSERDPTASRDTILKRAKAALYHDQISKIQTKRQQQETAERLRGAKGRFTAQPTTREGKPVSKEEGARRYVREFLKDRAGADDFAFEEAMG